MSDAGALPGSGFAHRLRRAENQLNRVLTWVGTSLLCISALLAIVSVALRYLFGLSYGIIEELCRFSIVYATLLFFGPLITRNAHLTMSIVTDMMSPAARRVFDIVLYILVTALLVLLFVAAWQWEAGLYAMGMMTMSGEMAAYLPSAALPIGVGLAAIYSALRVVYRIADLPLETRTETE